MANSLLFAALICLVATWQDYRQYQERLRYYYISDWVERECGRRAALAAWIAFALVLMTQLLREGFLV